MYFGPSIVIERREIFFIKVVNEASFKLIKSNNYKMHNTFKHCSYGVL